MVILLKKGLKQKGAEMKNFTKNIFFAALILAFGFLSLAIAQDKDSSVDVYAAFTLLEANIEINDYDSAWKLIAKPLQEEMFKGDIENFKKYHSHERNQPYEIKNVKFLTPEKAELTILRDNQQQVILMVQENGDWKSAGEVEKPATPPSVAAIVASSSAAQIYLAHETAIVNQDFQKAWDMSCASLQEARWKNDFEAFKKFYLEKEVKPNENERFLAIQNIKDISAKEVHIDVATGQTFVIVNDNGKWCFAGLLDDIRSGK